MGDTGGRRLTGEDGRLSLKDHITTRALEAREAHGDLSDLMSFARFLEDRRFVRYPVRLEFDGSALQEGEFAVALPLGVNPRDGFRLLVHPRFQSRPDLVPRLAAYHLVTVNYGEIVTHEEAELMGSLLMDLDPETYYAMLCEASDVCGGQPQVPAACGHPSEASGCDSLSTGCSSTGCSSTGCSSG